MTNTDGAVKEEAEAYEVLPSAKSLNLPLGIRCMEVNVVEVDQAVRQFTQKSTDITSPSWKFPHVSLEKLDVTHVMNVFRAHKALSDNQLYMELMELLIDRLYYAIMTSYEFVNGLEAAFTNAGFQIGGQSVSKRNSNKRDNWDPLEIAKKFYEDKTPKPFHTANIGMLVRQFCLKMMGLENIVLNNIHTIKKSESGGSAKVPNDTIVVRHSEVQTIETSIDSCESCYTTQRILKLVAEKIDTTLRNFNQSDSQISKTRIDLRKDALSITQQGALLRWLNALDVDCENIIKCANMLLDINVQFQEEVRMFKEDMEIKEEQHEKKMTCAQQSITEVKQELKNEQEARLKISKLKDATIMKLSELEKSLQLKTKEFEKVSQEREVLQVSFNIAEERNLQISSNLSRYSIELDKMKRDLELETNQKKQFFNQVTHLSAELAKTGQEMMKVTEQVDAIAHLEEENAELQEEVNQLRQITQSLQTRDADVSKALQELQTKNQHLTDELKKTHSHIELLTLYPDLNGPINTPMKTTGASCIETMEMQIKSNYIRMEILRAQSDRLTLTVSKLKTHMKSKPDAKISTTRMNTPSNQSVESSEST